MNRNAKSLQSKSKRHEVILKEKNIYRVTSASSGKTYTVFKRDVGYTCTCNWSEYHDTRIDPCSHVLAVEQWEEQGLLDRSLSFWASEEQAKKQHRPTSPVGVDLWATSRAL